MALGDYTKTTYSNGGPPAISDANLNNIENKVDELDAWAATPTADTIAERTGGSGVTIDGLLIKDGALGAAGGAGTVPVGALMPYAGATAPAGWFLCDGAAKSRSTYSALFTAIGEAYGVGDASTTFNLPDMRESVPVGIGTYSAVGGTTHGAITAHDAFTLGQFKDDQGQGHRHNSPRNHGSGGVGDGLYYTTSKDAGGILGVTDPITDGTNGTPRTGTVTRGKGLGFNYIIKY